MDHYNEWWRFSFIYFFYFFKKKKKKRNVYCFVFPNIWWWIIFEFGAINSWLSTFLQTTSVQWWAKNKLNWMVFIYKHDLGGCLCDTFSSFYWSLSFVNWVHVTNSHLLAPDISCIQISIPQSIDYFSAYLCRSSSSLIRISNSNWFLLLLSMCFLQRETFDIRHLLAHLTVQMFGELRLSSFEEYDENQQTTMIVINDNSLKIIHRPYLLEIVPRSHSFLKRIWNRMTTTKKSLRMCLNRYFQKFDMNHNADWRQFSIQLTYTLIAVWNTFFFAFERKSWNPFGTNEKKQRPNGNEWRIPRW